MGKFRSLVRSSMAFSWFGWREDIGAHGQGPICMVGCLAQLQWKSVYVHTVCISLPLLRWNFQCRMNQFWQKWRERPKLTKSWRGWFFFPKKIKWHFNIFLVSKILLFQGWAVVTKIIYYNMIKINYFNLIKILYTWYFYIIKII